MRLRLIPAAILLLSCTLVGAACQSENKPASVAQSGNGSATAASCQGAISWQDASKHVGDRATVEGAVVDAKYASSSNGQPTFLNIGKPYPDPAGFTALIWGSNRGQFSKAPETMYKGKHVCVTGLIETYQGSPEIVVDSPSQIVIAD